MYSCRAELLNIVRKHPSSIGQLSYEDAEVDPQFWCELLDLFFVRGLADREEEKADDDLVFFVRLQVSVKLNIEQVFDVVFVQNRRLTRFIVEHSIVGRNI